MKFIVLFTTCCFVFSHSFSQQVPGMKVSVFDIDATPPVGSLLTYDSMVNTWDMSLRAKGIVLTGSGLPIVLCSIDWIGIANEGYDEFRKAIAEAAGTIPERVALHTSHQHDAPICDFGVEKLYLDKSLDPLAFEGSFHRLVIKRLAMAISQSIPKAQAVTHIGKGKAIVYKVASNRRIIGPNGKAVASRTSATRDSMLRAAPEGLIDPEISLVSFWNQEKPVAVLSYYASHPQSYYRTGVANPDFPGIARFLRQLNVPSALHVHFNGAGGNITAGKYNDGAHENRLLLAERLADGMKRAWDSTQKEEISAAMVKWNVEPVRLPPAEGLAELESKMTSSTPVFISNNMPKLVWLRRLNSGKAIDLSCLSIGTMRILHLPGEPFIEYQLAAKSFNPKLFVTVAGYGDYAPGYICTSIAYQQGGYEAGQASGVSAAVEPILMKAIFKLLK